MVRSPLGVALRRSRTDVNPGPMEVFPVPGSGPDVTSGVSVVTDVVTSNPDDVTFVASSIS